MHDKQVFSIFELPGEEWVSDLITSKSGIIYLKYQLFISAGIKHEKERKNLNLLLLFRTGRKYILKNYKPEILETCLMRSINLRQSLDS